jgi:hypothetical protein
MARSFVIGALLVSLGGHLVLLQTVAWSTMLLSYSQNASLKEAAKKTFDGDHPCPLCKAVKESRKEEKKLPMFKAESKKEMLPPAGVALYERIGHVFGLEPTHYRFTISLGPDDVAVPPPRLA